MKLWRIWEEIALALTAANDAWQDHVEALS